VPPAIFLTSERLALRRLDLADRERLGQIHADPDVMRYVGGPLDSAGSGQILRERILDYYDEHPGLGIWFTIERSTGACIGLHLLNHVHGESHIQLGYLLDRAYWGRGYATEMSVALLRHGFTALALPQIVAITELPNHESQRVLTKAGLHRRADRSFPHPRYAPLGPLAWFTRDAADWLAEDAHRPSRSP
jgi:[ribosomal protein S5]-alanine N-acetyltransferase